MSATAAHGERAGGDQLAELLRHGAERHVGQRAVQVAGGLLLVPAQAHQLLATGGSEQSDEVLHERCSSKN